MFWLQNPLCNLHECLVPLFCRTFILHSGDEAQCTLTRLCDCVSFVLWLNFEVLVHVYCPSPGVQYPDGGMGFVFWESVGGY